MYSNALERRVRRMAQVLIQETRSEDTNNTFGLKLVLDRCQSVPLRIAGSILILMSSGLLLYQIVDRFKYYLSYPINVDVHIEEVKQLSFPQIVIASYHTREIIDLMNTAAVNRNDMITCDNLLIELMGLNISNVTYLWKASNTSSLVLKHEIVHDKEVMPLQMSSMYTPYSLAAAFHTTKEFPAKGKTTSVVVQLSRPAGVCEFTRIMIMFIGYGHAVDYQNAGLILGGYRTKIGITIKQYHFINRRAFSCVANEAIYENCMENCRLKLYKQLSCSFPFTPLGTGLSTCENTAIEDFHIASNIFRGTDSRFPDCRCIRPCDQKYYEFFGVPEDKTELGADISVYFLNNYVTITTERQAYDFISFLADAGGSAGLCLGLSILDIMYWVHYFAVKTCAQKTPVFKYNDPIFRIVGRVYSQITCKSINGSQNNLCSLITPKWLFISLISLLTCCLTFLRFEYYFRFPTTSTLTVEDSIIVQYPVVTVCWESKMIASRKHMQAKKNSLPDSCQLSLLDLMGTPLSYTAQKIWEYSYSGDAVMAMNSMADHIKVEPKLLPHGNCTTYISEPGSHAESYNDFYVYRLKSTKNCDRSVKVFITPRYDVIDPLNYELIPEVSGTALRFTLKIIQNNDVPLDIKTAKTAYDCKRKCIMQKITVNLKCTLPYIDNRGHGLLPCNTTLEAKRAEATYMDAFASTNPKRDCGCPPIYQEMVYTTTSLLNPLESGPTIMLFVFANSRVETLFKVFSYSTEKLVSETGSIVSSILGLSVISLVEILFRLCPKNTHATSSVCKTRLHEMDIRVSHQFK